MLKRLQQLMWWLPFGQVPEVDAAALARALATPEPPRLLDVRTRGEWEGSRIPGARNLGVRSLKRKLPALDWDRRRPVVAICLSAHRSIPAVRLLMQAGFSDVRQLRGGMIAWWRQGLPVERGRPASGKEDEKS
jgi:rhodanese-related sulfurtransferase